MRSHYQLLSYNARVTFVGCDKPKIQNKGEQTVTNMTKLKFDNSDNKTSVRSNFNIPLDTKCHFRDECFQTVDYTGTNNQTDTTKTPKRYAKYIKTRGSAVAETARRFVSLNVLLSHSVTSLRSSYEYSMCKYSIETMSISYHF